MAVDRFDRMTVSFILLDASKAGNVVLTYPAGGEGRVIPHGTEEHSQGTLWFK